MRSVEGESSGKGQLGSGNERRIDRAGEGKKGPGGREVKEKGGVIGSIRREIKKGATAIAREVNERANVANVLSEAQVRGIKRTVLRAGAIQQGSPLYFKQRRLAKEYVRDVIQSIDDRKKEFYPDTSALDEVINAVEMQTSGKSRLGLKCQGVDTVLEISYGPSSYGVDGVLTVVTYKRPYLKMPEPIIN